MCDPYSLPCRHTFCLRPCLLPDARVVEASFPQPSQQEEESDLTELQSDYNAISQSSLPSLQCGREQSQTGLVEKGNADEEEMLVGENWTEAIPNLTISCSACQRQVQPKLLVFCQHCQREVCVQCCSTHRDSVSIVHLLVVMQVSHMSCKVCSACLIAELRVIHGPRMT
ncbi:hypothetical protein TSMEX_004573 [Taenia solium]|eukprot:TsM_001158900 transcript=TsM_001158900 gene=TsM_001158900